ncbi:MAG: CinA family nicotinamide mononucleotide deamidase-related protein [Bacteroidota bacterium]|nr:CinA family nicotinamide mononucleotide deamidase-related protein [Bacteroidota bacterium]
MKRIKASIITIGDELLIGQVIDTNSSWMAAELNRTGIWVQYRIAVGDAWDDIWETLDAESSRSDIVLITGGLGPTKDDITKPLLCEYFGGKLVTDETALINVKNIFKKNLRLPLLERNLEQAEVPDNCIVIQNTRGTAPGMWFEKDNTIFVSMPGVPHEMKEMMLKTVIPGLQQRFQLPFIGHRTLLTAGIGESFLAERIQDFEKNLPGDIKLAYLPNYGMVRLRLTAQGDNPASTESGLDRQFDLLQTLVKDVLVVNEDIPMEAVVGRILGARNMTLATAESCTGGYIAHLITSIPGSSAYFKGCVVSYDNSIKENVLQVSKNTLDTAGAVSEETVRQMLNGLLTVMRSDYGIAVSGIMGPGGGTPEKPVGTVWIAVGNKDKSETRQFNFRFERKRNIELTGISALNMLRLFILKNAE